MATDQEKRAASSWAFVELRAEAVLRSAAVIAAYYDMGEAAFVEHARASYVKARVDFEQRKATHEAEYDTTIQQAE